MLKFRSDIDSIAQILNLKDHILNKSPIKVVVFDLDGTLVDTLPDMLHALNGALAQLGFPPVAAGDMRAATNEGLAGMARQALRLHGAPSRYRRDLLDRFQQCYAHRLCADSRAFQGARALLQALTARGVTCALCTNKPEALAVGLVQSLGLRPYLPVVVGGDTTEAAKPDPLPLRHALHALGVEARNAVLVGDSEVDAACGANAGVPVWLMSHGYAADPALYRTHHPVFCGFAAVQAALLEDGSKAPHIDSQQETTE